MRMIEARAVDVTPAMMASATGGQALAKREVVELPEPDAHMQRRAAHEQMMRDANNNVEAGQ